MRTFVSFCRPNNFDVCTAWGRGESLVGEFLEKPVVVQSDRGPLRLRSGQAFDCGCASLARSTILAQDDKHKKYYS
jgi:hypothetical protein